MIAVGLNSRVRGTNGDHHFFLCDYDGVKRGDVEEELRELGVHAYDLVRSGNGYHVYSFHPVRTWPAYGRLLRRSEFACANFVDCTVNRKFSTLRFLPREDLVKVGGRGWNRPPPLDKLEFCVYERRKGKRRGRR